MNPTQRSMPVLYATNFATIACVAVLFATRRTEKPPSAPNEISVERLNIVDPDGKLLIAISNKQRIPGPVVSGKSYPPSVSDGRGNTAGMIFFNEAGDEMGGLVFNSWRRPDGKIAGLGHLSFDRFNDNQVLALQYKENATTTQAGLTLYDRTAGAAFKASMDLIEEFPTASAERKSAIQIELAKMRERGDLGAERVFLGSKDNEAQLLLKDSKGRTRARLAIDRNDEPHLEFLDATGKVKSTVPARPGQ